jgi:16S rRNA A1518/A1519 N6-dimethyltransferase RsmA/KsgA/DIM1 with predicted DNA glycosylase/AP lyase activity
MAMFDLLAHPHSSMPYVQMDLMTALYIKILFSIDKFDFRPMSQFNSLIIKLIKEQSYFSKAKLYD